MSRPHLTSVEAGDLYLDVLLRRLVEDLRVAFDRGEPAAPLLRWAPQVKRQGRVFRETVPLSVIGLPPGVPP